MSEVHISHATIATHEVAAHSSINMVQDIFNYWWFQLTMVTPLWSDLPQKLATNHPFEKVLLTKSAQREATLLVRFSVSFSISFLFNITSVARYKQTANHSEKYSDIKPGFLFHTNYILQELFYFFAMRWMERHIHTYFSINLFYLTSTINISKSFLA